METEDLLKLLGNILKPQEGVKETKSAKARVKVVVNEKSKLKVTPYEGNPDLGYVQLEEVTIGNSSLSWKRRKRRTALMKGDVDVLQDWLAEYKGGVLPGKIVVLEYVESEIPEEIEREFFGDPDGEKYDELKESYVKRSGDDGIALLSDGEEIYRFQVYDEEDVMEDRLIEHDNSEDVRRDSKLRRMREKEERAEREAAEAKAKKLEDAKNGLVNEGIAPESDAKTGDKKADLPK